MNHPLRDEQYMHLALEQAASALKKGEFPVGCVIVHEDRVVASGVRTATKANEVNEIDHAEMVALRQLAESQNSLDRNQLTLYCSLEPCLMCFGAIILSGIRNIVYAYEDTMGGGTSCNLGNMTPLYREAEVSITPYVLREKSLKLFKAYFGNPANEYWKDSPLANYTLSQ